MIDVYRMVSRLVKLVQDANLTTSLSSSCEDSIAEIVFGNNLRTREGEDYATRFNLLKSLHIKTGVALESITQSSTMLGKGWWVENDKVVVVASLIEVFEGILAISHMTLVIRKIEVDILSGQFDSP